MQKSFKYEIIGGNKNATIDVVKREVSEITYLDLNLKLNNEIPEKTIIRCKVPATNSLAIWSSFDRVHTLRPDWGMNEINSRLASGMPIQQLFGFDGNNRMCVSVSDVDTPIKIRMGYIEENAEVICEVEFFSLQTNKKSEYNATVRFDFRNVKYYDSIYDTVNWWENECGYKSAFVPEHAKLPMDSLWYSFHQNLEYEKIIEECKNSKELGLETVIIDDGWQTEDNNRGYAFCGDWEVSKSKMNDMKKLVAEIHKLGMKVMLWYSVPFMGIHSKRFEEFKTMLLDESGDNKTFFALDPRYKKVRDYLSNLYENAIKEWDLDGLKLDFIDSFVLKGNSLETDERRDYESLEDAIHALLSETKEKLTKLKSDVLIEFRQSYVGPSIRKYGNMLRVGDCPGDVLTNRSQAINLRFTSGKTAVHSDMLMWNKTDSVENAAEQFINIIYTVPQISVLINELNEEQKKMLRFYISFWKENQDVLLNGKLTAENPECEYSIARVTLNETEIITPYTNSLVEIYENKAIVINATLKDSVVLKSAKGYSAKVVNCLGEIISEFVIENTLEEISVPRAGIIYLNK
ncbi:MAG: alpha-galactosidase [Clostridia bacterium]|nr:alpha-galactosidase [Clostridia bacterium]